MSSSGAIVVWGAGGHAVVVAEAARAAGLAVAAFLVDVDGGPDRVDGAPVVRSLEKVAALPAFDPDIRT